MKRIGIAILVCVVSSIGAPSSAGVRVEFGASGNLLTSLEGEETLVDGFNLRAVVAGDTDGPVQVGAAVTWRYQRHEDNEGIPYEPVAIDPCRRGWKDTPDSGESNFLEISVVARALEDRSGLRPFAELEGGVAFNDLEEAGPDIVVSFTAGVIWRFESAEAIVLGVGHRLYLPSDRLTVPVGVSYVMEF